jgi:hypothetical protein
MKKITAAWLTISIVLVGVSGCDNSVTTGNHTSSGSSSDFSGVPAALTSAAEGTIAPTPDVEAQLLAAAQEGGMPRSATIQQARAKIEAIKTRCVGKSDGEIVGGVIALRVYVNDAGRSDTAFDLADAWYNLLQPGENANDCDATLTMMAQAIAKPR